jgi:beta-glucosidase
MANMIYRFPDNFMWGTATSAYQVEGGNLNNNWSAWEQEPDRIVNGERAGRACDWWRGRWREDFDRAAECGQNALRISIEWSRVQPEEGRWDEQAIETYRAMLQGLVQRKLTPFVALHHFTDPLWFVEKGGWQSETAPEDFVKFVEKVVEATHEYVGYWIPFNEPNVLVVEGYLEGLFPPGEQDMQAALRAAENLVRAHGLAYETIHHIQPEAMVGIAHNYRPFWPANPGSPLDQLTAKVLHQAYNNSFIELMTKGHTRILHKRLQVPEAAKSLDFLGINYYTGDRVGFSLKPPLFHQPSFPPEAALSENGFIANLPEGIYEALEWGHGYGLPMIVTENGVEDASDSLRPRYLLEHLHQVWRAWNQQWPVLGYFHWTLVDNFEWERGWTQRFGLWALDTATQTRIPRPSARLYERICREKGVSSEAVKAYAPEVFEKIFP